MTPTTSWTEGGDIVAAAKRLIAEVASVSPDAVGIVVELAYI
jgi:hypothetical protein